MTSQIEQQESGLQGHLPECYQSEGKFDGGCICHRLRSCEARSLDAAWQAVAQECSTYPDLCGQCRANVYAIEALREQPADQTGYKLPDAR